MLYNFPTLFFLSRFSLAISGLLFLAPGPGLGAGGGGTDFPTHPFRVRTGTFETFLFTGHQIWSRRIVHVIV